MTRVWEMTYLGMFHGSRHTTAVHKLTQLHTSALLTSILPEVLRLLQANFVTKDVVLRISVSLCSCVGVQWVLLRVPLDYLV